MRQPSWYYSDANIFHLNYQYLRVSGVQIENPFLFFIKTIFQNAIIWICSQNLMKGNPTNGYISDFLEDAAIVLAGSSMTYNILCFRFKSKEINSLVDRLNDYRLFGKPTKLEKTKKALNLLLRVYQVFVTFGVSYYILFKYFNKSKCTRHAVRDGKQRICGLICQVVYFEGAQTFPYNQLIYLLQVIGTLLTVQAGSATFIFIISLCEHVIARVDHLMLMISKIDELTDGKTKRVHFNNCVEYHKDIISLVDQLNRCFSGIMFAVITADTVVIGIIMVQFLVEPTVDTTTHLVGWIVTLFGISLTGQRLHDRAISLQICISGLKLYDQSLSLQKDLMFVMLRSQKPLALQAGGFGIMSLPTFLAAMKTSYSYVAVVQQTL